jgi:hypothetical protein
MFARGLLHVAACFAVCSLAIGCGQSNIKELTRPAWIPEVAEWPELVELYSGLDGSNLQRAFRRAGGNAQVPAWFNDPKFVDALQKFESTPIPAKYANPEREADKKELLTLIKQLQQPAGKSTAKPAEVAITLRKILDAYDRITYVPDQVAPTGEEAKKYSTVAQPRPDPRKKAAK